MSHVVEIKHRIKDLDCLAQACKDLGLDFRKGQKTFRWWGKSMGDFALPKGFTADDLGKCIHAIGRPDDMDFNESVTNIPTGGQICTGRPYELGVVEARDGQGGYALLFDFYAGGYGLEEKVGKGAQKLLQRYEVAVATKVARRQGYALREHTREDGTVELTCTKKAGY
jgi:hypothetical protein